MLDDFNLAQTLVRIAAALVLGLVISLFYMFRNNYNKAFIMNLVLMPAIVGAVISIVNGNLGTGVAVMGAFSLVRFRSIPGTAREIGYIFFAMAVGLATGMGYIPYAAVFTVVVGLISMLLWSSRFGEPHQHSKRLKVTIPENLNYYGLFDDLFLQYARSWKIKQVRTTNMGSLYQLQYDIVLKDDKLEKDMIDALRCRNGNLDIICGQITQTSDAL